MKGYINIPESFKCKGCKLCGSAPIISLAEHGLYQLKCPNNDSHYQTNPGEIDIDDWNIHNTQLYDHDYDLKMISEG
ncbi:hypothetical protein [Mucilaginibacter gilvus]|uniref:Uncharacterized protein n=1 Tax=Mucilaginibacter gilvus TaxID=2305909 RepID=A0A444MMY0_9SPHI|nr:hypothetical protein [Mucilaginibacter gilvus]RWY51075.1 hypothetical protein EPL05_13480 [Mucilaginibacter gilvus]